MSGCILYAFWFPNLLFVNNMLFILMNHSVKPWEHQDHVLTATDVKRVPILGTWSLQGPF